MRSILGTILDPAADKILMTTLVVTLTMKGLLPRTSVVSSLLKLIITETNAVPLAVIVLGRDVLLSFAAFYIRYTSLSAPVRTKYPLKFL